MQFFSTRDQNRKVTSSEAIAQGLSNEGGLFVPESFPQVDVKALCELDYPAMAAAVIKEYLTDYSQDFLTEAAHKTYGEAFGGKAGYLAPVEGDTYALELWHGPTCAFKDYALQLMPKLLVEAKKNLGRTEYSEAWEIQKRFFGQLLLQKQQGSAEEQYLLLVEHPHVYTLGKSGHESNLLVNGQFLAKIGATYFRTDRGGDVTYHGLGQLVGYPILDLERIGVSLRDYIFSLEESVIRTVADYGITAGRLEGATGVWIDPHTPRARKICAIGVKASHFVTMHGFALNVTTDLNYFSHINPCGFTDKGVTSIERETGLKPSLEEVGQRFTAHFGEILKIELK